MNQFTIDRTRITRVRNNNLTAYASGGQIVIRRSRPDGKGGWIADPVVATDLFGVDIWQLEVGYEVWGETNGKRHREVALVPYGQTPPETPIDGSPIYQLPIYSSQWGGRADLTINDRVGSEALADLCDDLENHAEFHAVNPPMIPHIEVTGVEEGPFGIKPIFAIAEWAERPARWGDLKIKPIPAVIVASDRPDIMQRLHERNLRRVD